MTADARAAALAALLALTAPAAAAPGAAPAADPDAIVAEATARAQADDCAGVLRLLDPLVARARTAADGRARFAAQLLRMPCLGAVGRGREVAPVLAELKAQQPDNPLVRGYQIFVDAAEDRPAAAADGLTALADTSPRLLDRIPGSLWRAVAQRLTVAHDTARRDRTVIALARAGWTPADRPELGEALAAQAIGLWLAQNDPDQARALLPRVREPGTLWDMAIQRRYAPLWPEIEARLGPASGDAADRYAATALARFAAGPDDPAARRDAAYAFSTLARPDDVAATAAPVAVAPGMDEDRVDIVLADARARAAAGDRAGAIARLAPFERLGLDTAPAAASALIALAEYRHDAGDYAGELAVARAAIARGRDAFSAFGLQWMRRDEVCALAGLGRADEAAAAAAPLAAAAPDNEAAAVEGLLCAGRDDEAARIAVAAFATPDGADRLADQFQPRDAMFFAPASTLRPLWERLLKRADVRAAFDRAARILPRAQWPARLPRPLPAPRGGVDATTT